MLCACDALYSFLCIVFHPFFFQSLYFSLLSLLIRFCLYINIRFYCIPWIHLFIIMPCGRYPSRSTEKFYVPFPRFSIAPLMLGCLCIIYILSLCLIYASSLWSSWIHPLIKQWLSCPACLLSSMAFCTVL